MLPPRLAQTTWQLKNSSGYMEGYLLDSARKSLIPRIYACTGTLEAYLDAFWGECRDVLCWR